MNYKKLFEIAKLRGITALTIQKNAGSAMEFVYYKGELESFANNSSSNFVVRGIYNNQFGSVATEIDDIDYILDSIISAAKNSERKETPEIFAGSKSYKKRDYYNKELINYPLEKQMEQMRELEKVLYSFDERISDVHVSFETTQSASEIHNSYGLNLKTKTCYYVVVAELFLKNGSETKSHYEIFVNNDPKALNIQEFAKKAYEKIVSKINGVKIKSKKYKAILSPEAVSSLIMPYISWCNSEDVQKKSSRFIDMLGKKVASKKLTVREMPLLKNPFGRGFDSEGVATYNKTLINKGVLETYVYNLETARKEGRESTGNGYGKQLIGVGFTNIVVKQGKKSEEDAIASVKEGVYISSVTGLHSGLNGDSGNFSLQAEGFEIKDGKLGEPLKMITIAGNLMDLFNDVSLVCSNSKLHLNEVTCPSLLIKKLAVTSE